MLRLALNRIADDAAWDREALALEFSDILELDTADRSRDERLRDGRDRRSRSETAASIRKTNYSRSTLRAAPVTRIGDLWILGEHRLLCGDALQAESYARVLGTDKRGHDVCRPAL